MNQFFLRISEYKVMIYRIALAYLFYFFARVLFYVFNADMLDLDSVSDFFKISYHGIAFDTTAILYLSGLFILFSLLPLWKNDTLGYQKFLVWLYFVPNLVGYALNFVDLIYYKYNFARTTLSAWDVIKNEESLFSMFFRFLLSYWYVFLLYFIFAFLWIFLYLKIKVKENKARKNVLAYISFSIIWLLFFATIAVGGIRGDFKKSTRPINLIDANRHVAKPQQADLVLNTPFAFIRTMFVQTFKKTDYNISKTDVEKFIMPIKQYGQNPSIKPNIVLFITESYGREYIGAFNKHTNIEGYKSYTPFLDKLCEESLIFPNAYGNGYKSIHGMSSVLSGIPAFHDAFTSSPYAKQKIQSLVSCLKEEGYDTSFFHGAPNGSMGFLGFGNILGFDHYYGMIEYGNDADFDGSWGIWDEEFFQFMKKTLDQKKTPFFSTIFTVTSHEPYVVPKKYEGKFDKGTVPMHQVVGYTDMAFEKFFEASKKQPWFKNTIFIITADHCNNVAFGDYYYDQLLERDAVPIIIYDPNGKYKGENLEVAQHIDIYPTILDMIGYKKPFRSWGQSLLAENKIEPYVIMYKNNHVLYLRGNYFMEFDFKKPVGFYKITDKKMKHNLISQNKPEFKELEIGCKAFLQDYYERIIDKKLTAK